MILVVYLRPWCFSSEVAVFDSSPKMYIRVKLPN